MKNLYFFKKKDQLKESLHFYQTQKQKLQL